MPKIVGVPIPVEIIPDESESEHEPVEESQIVSTQVTVDSSLKSESPLIKDIETITPIPVEIIPITPAPSDTKESGFGSSEIVISSIGVPDESIATASTSQSDHDRNHIVTTTITSQSANYEKSSTSVAVDEPIAVKKTVYITGESPEKITELTEIESVPPKIEILPMYPLTNDSMEGSFGSSQIVTPSPEVTISQTITTSQSDNVQSEIVTTTITSQSVNYEKSPDVAEPIMLEKTVIDEQTKGIPSTPVIIDSTKKSELPNSKLIETIIPAAVEIFTIQSTKSNTNENDIESVPPKIEILPMYPLTNDSMNGDFGSSQVATPSSEISLSQTISDNGTNQIDTTITSTESSANKNSFSVETIEEPVASTSFDYITETTTEKSSTDAPSPRDEKPTSYYEFFWNFVGGLISTTPQTSKDEPDSKNEPSQIESVTIVTSPTDDEPPKPMVGEESISSTIEIVPSDSTSNQIVTTETVVDSPKVVELITPLSKTVTITSTEPTSTGYQETTITTTESTSAGPAFLEKTISELQSEMTSSSSSSSQVYHRVYGPQDGELLGEVDTSERIISSSTIHESSVTTVSSETFSSFSEIKSSTITVTDGDNVASTAIIEDRPTESNPTIVEISSSTLNSPSEPGEFRPYTVSEPSHDY